MYKLNCLHAEWIRIIFISFLFAFLINAFVRRRSSIALEVHLSNFQLSQLGLLFLIVYAPR